MMRIITERVTPSIRKHWGLGEDAKWLVVCHDLCMSFSAPNREEARRFVRKLRRFEQNNPHFLAGE
jgi:hypothetical protein